MAHKGAEDDFGHLRVVGVGGEAPAISLPPEFEAGHARRPVLAPNRLVGQELRWVTERIAHRCPEYGTNDP